jgi:threonine aldolase
MDGARLVNALAALDVSPAAITWQAGVDIVCLGGTKQGMPMSEAIVIFDQALAQEFDYLVPDAVVDALHGRGWHFYRFTPTHHRLMCSWATEPRHIDAFVDDLAGALAAR